MANSQKTKPKHFYDYSLLFSVIFLTIFGLIMIYSSSSYMAQLKYNNAAYFLKKQGAIAMAGVVAMIFVSSIGYRWYRHFAVLGYFISLGLMIAVHFIGREVNGKRRWLGVGPLSFQPTEVVKIALIILMATIITAAGKKIEPSKLFWRIMFYAVPVTLLVTANNLSSGIIIAGIVFVMMFISFKKKWPFYAIVAAGGIVFSLAAPIAHFLTAAKILKPYQLSRINVWLNPEAYPSTGGYQVLQGLYAIGSGGFFGRGLGESIQKMGFVPEAQNDMIFSIICEELGLFGAICVILIFMFMIYRFTVIASNAPDLFGALLVVGVMAHISIQVILNIAVVTNTIPNTGITLPFISYGGTSVFFTMIEIGMVLGVSNSIRVEK